MTNTPKELFHIAQGCRVSRLPWECVQETHLPRMGYVKNDDGTPLGPLGYTVGIIQTQGSSLREQPWALRHNSVGVEDIDNKDQRQISSSRQTSFAAGLVRVRTMQIRRPNLARGEIRHVPPYFSPSFKKIFGRQRALITSPTVRSAAYWSFSICVCRPCQLM